MSQLAQAQTAGAAAAQEEAVGGEDEREQSERAEPVTADGPAADAGAAPPKPPPRRLPDEPLDSEGRQKIVPGGTLKVFVEFVGGQPHHTEMMFSDRVELHTRLRGRTTCRVGSPAHIETCPLSVDAHNAANAAALTKLGGTWRGESPRYQPLKKYAKYQPRPVCRYRLGGFLSRPSPDESSENEAHPYCFAATVHTRPGLSYWRYTYSSKATGPEADKAKLAACALAISDWFAQGSDPSRKPAREHLTYSFALRSHNRGPQFKLLREQQVRRSAADSSAVPEHGELAKLPKDAVVEAVDVSEEIDAQSRRRVRHILVGVGSMEPKHVHTLLMQCGLSAQADTFFDAAINGEMLLKLKFPYESSELAQLRDQYNTCKDALLKAELISAPTATLQQRSTQLQADMKAVHAAMRAELDKWCANAQVTCNIKTRRIILRAVEEIESGTGKASGWITVPAAPRPVRDNDDSDSSDGYDDDVDLWALAEAPESPRNGLMTVASSPRVSASGQAAVYAPPYSVVGENALRLGGAASSHLVSRRRINKQVLGRRKTLEQGYSHTEVTLRTAFPLEVLESYAKSQQHEWRSRGFKWGPVAVEAHISTITHAIALSRTNAARRSSGVDAPSEHTEEVVALLLQAERGNPHVSPAIAELEQSLKMESVDNLKKRLAMSEMITDDAVAAAERAGKADKPGGVLKALRQLLLDVADNKDAAERLLEKLIVHAERLQASASTRADAEAVFQQELEDAVELGSPTAELEAPPGEVRGSTNARDVPAQFHLKLVEAEPAGIQSNRGTVVSRKKKKTIPRKIKPMRPTVTMPFKLGLDAGEHTNQELESSEVAPAENEAVMQLQGRSLAQSRQMTRQNSGHAGRWSWEWRQSSEGKRALAQRRKALNHRYSTGSAPTATGVPDTPGNGTANARRDVEVSVEQARARGAKVDQLRLGDAILEQANLGVDDADKLWRAGLTNGAQLASQTDEELKAVGISVRALNAIRKAYKIIDNTRSVVVEVGASESNRKVVLVRGLLAADVTPVGPIPEAHVRFAVNVQRVGAKPTDVPEVEREPKPELEPEPEPEPEPEQLESQTASKPDTDPEQPSEREALFRPLIDTALGNGESAIRGIHQLEVIRLGSAEATAAGEEGWSFNLRVRCTVARHSTSSSPLSGRRTHAQPLSASAGNSHWDHVHASATTPTPAKYREIAQHATKQAKHASLDAAVAQAEGHVVDAAVAKWFQQQAERKATAAVLSAAIRKGQQVDTATVPSPSLQSPLSVSIPVPSYWEWKQTPEGRRTLLEHSKHVDALYSRDRKGRAKTINEIEADIRSSHDHGTGHGAEQRGLSAAQMVAELDGRALARKSIRVQL